MSYGGGLLGVVLLIRLVLIAIWVGLPVLLVGAFVWWTTSRKGIPPESRARQTRSARLTGLGIGAAVGIVLIFTTDLWLAPIAVAAGYLLGVLNGELHGTPPQTGSLRVASLQPRTAKHYVPGWAAALAIAAAVLTTCGPIVLATMPTASYPPLHPFPQEPSITIPGATDTWPSPGLWIPLAVVACGALVGGALLVRRLLRLPAASTEAPGLAEAARRNAARAVAGTVAGIELLALGAQTIFASSGISVPNYIGGTAYTASRIMVWSGVGLVAAGIIVWCVLSSWRREPTEPASQVITPQT